MRTTRSEISAPCQRSLSKGIFCFLGGKRALLVLPASTRGGSSPVGTDGPGRESRRGGSSRQTARGEKNQLHGVAIRPSPHPRQQSPGKAVREQPPWAPAAPRGYGPCCPPTLTRDAQERSRDGALGGPWRENPSSAALDPALELQPGASIVPESVGR